MKNCSTNIRNREDRDQKSQDSVGLYHGGEEHGLTELIRLLCYNANGGHRSTALMVAGDKSHNGDGKAGRQVQKSRPGIRNGAAPQDTDPCQRDKGDQKSIDTLGTGKELQEQNLGELIRILRDDAGAA